MDAAWPAPERRDTGEWVLRAAGGVTQRANSVWPRVPAADAAAAVRDAASWYRLRRLPVIYQIFDHDGAAPLNAVLDSLGYTRQSETLVMSRPAEPHDGLPASAGVEISEHPSAEWLELWWSVDGRGGAAELETAREILTGCPALYALARDDDGGPAAVGRLAVVPGGAADSGGTADCGAAGSWGGLYCMATRPDARRRGYATRVQQALVRAGGERGLAGYWLLVMASNSVARKLYSRAGFREVSRYCYRQERPRRALTGC
ncbi:GNAT family N-acetyltransferase [Arthrobacter sp. UC242_113]|uniref:GNAT family N-acetyltransferase n=1 Tax=Arthrobacter sp. UC242_113 TaxID=3374550 RepID=UPI0037576263